jgi:hypothetical protein
MEDYSIILSKELYKGT